MFDHVDVHLERPLCEHLPNEHKETWRWYFTVSTDNGTKRIELHVYCQVCKRRASIKQKDVPVQFMVDGKLASEFDTPPDPDSPEAAAERANRVTHERGFTPYDKAICKKLGIRYEGP